MCSSALSQWNRLLNTFSKYGAGLYFGAGLVAATIIFLTAFSLSGLALVSQHDLDEQLQQISDLQQENYELTDDLFRFQGSDTIFDSADLPYQAAVDAHALVSAGKQQALQDGRFLMITFGANWCLDCRTLHRHLQSDDVQEYTDGLFHFVNVDVGKFNNNRDVAIDLGVDLAKGIPVSIFFDPEGHVIGTTNDGQLEPARYYSSKQILKFVRDVAEKSLIVAPDSVQ
jgi:protein disulfide-isomerase